MKKQSIGQAVDRSLAAGDNGIYSIRTDGKWDQFEFFLKKDEGGNIEISNHSFRIFKVEDMKKQSIGQAVDKYLPTKEIFFETLPDDEWIRFEFLLKINEDGDINIGRALWTTIDHQNLFDEYYQNESK